MENRDPAFLFYDGDAARDVSHMNRLERGCYFDIIQAQRKFGKLAKQVIKKILGKDYESCWESIEICLTRENDMYFIDWLEKSSVKRKKYSESRRQNRIGFLDTKNEETQTRYDNDMENENENENVNVVYKWNLFAKQNNLSEIIKLTDKRKSGITQRLLEKEFNFDKILEMIKKSDFLLGLKTGWKVDFDFIFCSKNNYLKILESKYDGNSRKNNAKDNRAERVPGKYSNIT